VGSRDEWSRLSGAFGAAVRARREQLDISQEELGFRSDLDRTYISGIERGVRNPTLKIIGRLARALATRPSKLLSDAESSAQRAR
jgi:transcriptional regulator with XRE-family HTH domain